MNYRYKFTIEYNGSRFDSGWQKQNDEKTSVQGSIENALYKLTNEKVKVYCAGRTDRDVNAYGQVIHADFAKPYGLKVLHDGGNFHLKDSGCRIIAVEPVSQEFHARFSVKMKTYEYVISHARLCSVFDENRVWWIHSSVKFDLNIFIAQSKYLLGTHDFSSFRDSSCQARSPIKLLESIDIWRNLDKIFIQFRAKSFMHKQIRIMVGTLYDISRGRIKNTISEILLMKNRAAAGQTAPGCGLFLKSIEY